MIGLVSAFGCSQKSKRLPVPESELPALLADLHLAEAIIQNSTAATRDSIADLYYQQIFQLHNLDEADFDSTMAILREDPARLEPVYTKVLEILAEKDALLDR